MIKKRILGLMIILLSLIVLTSYAFAATTNDIKTGTPTSSKVLVNGVPIEFEAYLIDGSNYFKLRDIAMAVNNTNSNFSVEWNPDMGAIVLEKNTKYIEQGGELVKGDGEIKQAALSSAPVFSNFAQLNLTAYTINGYNFFKLRDIADAMKFNVTWSTSENTVGISTTGFFGLSDDETIKYKDPVSAESNLSDKVDYSEFVGYYYSKTNKSFWTEKNYIIEIKTDGVYIIPDPNDVVEKIPYIYYKFKKAPYSYGDSGIIGSLERTPLIISCVQPEHSVILITKNNKGVPCIGFTDYDGKYLNSFNVEYEFVSKSLSDIAPFVKKKELEVVQKKERQKAERDRFIALRNQQIEKVVSTLDRNSPITATNFLQGRFTSKKTNSELLIGYWLPYDYEYNLYNQKSTRHYITYRSDYTSIKNDDGSETSSGNCMNMGDASMTVSGNVTTFWIDNENYAILTAKYGSSISNIKLMINGEIILNGPIDYIYADNIVE